jgi:hypothetical protein
MSRFVEIVPDDSWGTTPTVREEERQVRVLCSLVGVPYRVFVGTEELEKAAEFLRLREEQQREIIRKWSEQVNSMFQESVKSCFVSSEPEADAPIVVEEKK